MDCGLYSQGMSMRYHLRPGWGVRLLTLVCFFMLQGYASSARGQSYDEWVERAIQAVEADSLERAVEMLRQAVKSDPAHAHNVWLYTNMGRLQGRLQHFDESVESYTFALNVAPYHVPALMGRASVYMEMGRLELARVDYSLVLDIEKGNEEALLMRAYIYKVQRQYKFARADYDRLLQLHADHFNARLGLALLLQAEGEREQAIRLLDILITEAKGDVARATLLYRARAEVEWESEQYDAALVDVDQSLQLDAAQAEAYLLRGQIYLALGKKLQAKRDFNQAQSLGIPLAQLKPLLARCR